MSTILMGNNGKASTGKRSRAINVRYFYITDCVKNKLLAIKHCPTEDILGDFLTKPLQGTKFVAFRDQLLGIS